MTGRERRRLSSAVYTDACCNWVLAPPADDRSSFWKLNGYVITSKHHIPRRSGGRKEGKREMRAWNFYGEECLLDWEDFCCSCRHHPGTWTVTHPPCWIASVTTRALANMAACFFFFFFPSLRHEVAVPRIPTCGPLNLACEKCGAQVRNRNETQVITPSDTTPGGGRRL